MNINSASFIMSNPSLAGCPKPDLPEFAFIGRSNVGKSSLINMLVEQKSLAKTSGQPGKTQLINHFIINKEWYLVDLPGYGFAKVSKKMRQDFEEMISNYLLKRENLVVIFVLIDSRHEPQLIDLEFVNWLGQSQIPFNIIFTKADKQSATKTDSRVAEFKKAMLETWEELPDIFVTSAEDRRGRNEVLGHIHALLKSIKA